MKTSTKFIFAILFLFPTIIWAIYFFYTADLKKIDEEYPFENAIQIAENSNDIDWIRRMLILTLNSESTASKRNIENYTTITELLLTFAACNAILLILLIIDIKKMVSNKALHPSAKDAPGEF